MSLKSLIVRIRGDNKNLKSSMKDSEKSVGKFGQTVKKLGGLIAGAFAIGILVRFTKEVFNIAAKAEGVEAAFKKLNDPNLLDDLKEATRGTVSEVELMQKAVQAKNFKIPLDQLATYFKFATNRAIETGESVDYLVSSIITGIGRKSVLVMDNLGISAVELQEEVKKVGDFGAAAGVIIARELENAGDVSDTAATKVATLAAKWEDAKRSFGEYLANSEKLKEDLTEWAIFFELLADKTLSFGEKLGVVFGKKYAEYADEASKKQKELAENMAGGFEFILESGEKVMFMADGTIKKISELDDVSEEYIKTLNDINEEIAEYSDKIKGAAISETEYIRQLYAAIAALEKQKKAVEDLGIARAAGGQVGTVAPITDIPTIGNISSDLGKTLEPMVGAATGVWDLVNAIRALGDEASPALQRFADTVIAWQDTMNDMKMAVVDLATSLTNTLFEALGSGNFDDLGKDMLMGFADFLGKLGKLMVAYGLVASGFWEAMANPNPATAAAAIVLGAMAIAAAAAIKGALNNASKATSGGSNVSHSKATTSPQSQTVQVYGRLRGSDIVIVSDRANSNKSTIT